ncbi:TadE/TadG family type IV pilus assembly protein [uncultured Schumannella sp.]|uniref:TadE/TadG family type IV pilus assembly protein n=1 Tax=uncultured Schumannella sp. TaxID=1195956 RepID=UPI0025EBE2FA|nr:TadE family protein [uncultured Schumannella sp.]
MSFARRLADERGSAPAEFALVGALLTMLTVAVLQLGLALHVRNSVLDAAAEGARYGALADRGPADAAARTAELITLAVGADYARDISVSSGEWQGHPALTVTVHATLPLIGLLGAERALEVTGHAAIETLD